MVEDVGNVQAALDNAETPGRERRRPPQPEKEFSDNSVKTIATTVCICFAILGTASCSVLSGPETTKQTAIQLDVVKAKNDAVAKLIDKGVNPVSARCAIFGWENRMSSPDALVCATAGRVKAPKEQ